MTEQSPTGHDSLGDPRVRVLLVDDDEVWTESTAEILDQQRDLFDIETATSYSEAYNALTPGVDCVVCDYDLGDRSGLDLLTSVRDESEIPFILITEQGSESIASDAIGKQVTEYIPKRSIDGYSDLLARRIESVVESYRTTRALTRERRGKNLILDILTETSSRDALMRAFCEHLVDEHTYGCAWIGTLDEANRITPEAVAGAEEYLDDALDAEGYLTDTTEPGVVAAVGGETYVISDLSREPEAAPWRAAAAAQDFESAAATPVRHDNVMLGVLAVYRFDREFTPASLELLEEYANALDYAIRSARWRESLVSTTPVTIEFELSGECVPLVTVDDALPVDSQLDVLTTVLGDGVMRYVLRVTGVSASELRDSFDTVDASLERVTPSEDGTLRCEVVTAQPTPEAVLADHGGRLVSETVTAGTVSMTVHLSEGTSVQSFRNALRDYYPDVGVRSVQSTDRTERLLDNELPASLTEKQRSALEMAYFSGYFERPRENNTTEVAEKLGVSRQTFTQHLRAGERKVFRQLFDP